MQDQVDIAVREVGFTVRTREDTDMRILDGISLDVQAGEFVAVVGPSGCGKSTLLNFIAGLLPLTEGAIELAPRAGEQEPLGYIFQTDALLPWRKVVDNVALGLELRGMNRSSRRARAGALLAQLGLENFADHLPSELSGGMRQRVSLARTWILDPAILLMDEPFGALDAQTRLVVQDMFAAYWEDKKTTVVLVTHDIDEAILLADRIVVLSARPATIKAIHEVVIPRPRSRERLRESEHYMTLWETIWGELRSDAVKALEAGQ